MTTPAPAAAHEPPRRFPIGVAVTLGLVLFVSYAYFSQGGGWNQNTRLDVARAVAEHGTFRIDRYAANTHDRAVYGGHVYSDKAPAQQLVAVVPVAAARPVLGAAHVDTGSARGARILGYAATVTTSSLPAAIAGVALFWIAFALGASITASLLVALAFGLTTPMWAYATLLWDNAMAIAALLLAFACCIALRNATDPRRAARRAVLMGLAGAWSVVSNYAMAGAVAFVLALAFVGTRDHALGRARTVRAIAAGAAAPLVLLALYNTICFGTPFHVGYQDITESQFQAMHSGFLGLHAPSLHVLVEILFGRYRGLLPIAPALAIAPVGLYLLARARPTRAYAITAAAIIVYFVVYNTSYTFWDGGWSFGPRHLSGALPFLCLGFAPLWDAARRWLRTIVVVLVAFGGLVTFAAVATDPQPPTWHRSPVSNIVVPAIEHNNVALGSQSFLEAWPHPLPSPHRAGGDAFNIGTQLGLDGLWSLVPLLVLWGLGVAVYRRARPRSVPAVVIRPSEPSPQRAYAPT